MDRCPSCLCDAAMEVIIQAVASAWRTGGMCHIDCRDEHLVVTRQTSEEVSTAAGSVLGDPTETWDVSDVESEVEVEWFGEVPSKVLRTLSRKSSTLSSQASCGVRPASSTSTASSVSSGPDEQTLIVFDWDDTLMPTSYVKANVENYWAPSQLASDSPILVPLRQHAETVAAILRAARAVGRVAIVTLSKKPWVHDSAEKFLPGLDLKALLEELGIPIYYGLDHVHSTVARLAQTQQGISQLQQGGVDVLEACKRGAMAKCLRKVCGKNTLQLNVLSVGDSDVEKKAIKDLLWFPTPNQLPPGEHLCKTIKFMEEPTVQQLGDQLRVLRSRLVDMVSHREDVDLNMHAVGDQVLVVAGSFSPSKESGLSVAW